MSTSILPEVPKLSSDETQICKQWKCDIPLIQVIIGSKTKCKETEFKGIKNYASYDQKFLIEQHQASFYYILHC